MINPATKALLELGFITGDQYQKIVDYRSRSIFSLHLELRLLLYLSIVLFTSGVGVVVYNNIGSIGHLVIIALILLLTAFCFYFSFKNSKGFSKQLVVSEKPLFDYLVLAANLLTGVLITYLQFQYDLFGTLYGLATLVPTLIYFFSAYYFDHRGVLSLAITGLAAFVGFSAAPMALLNNDFFSEEALTYYAIGLGLLLILWTIYAAKTELKQHFNYTYQNFALHFICLAALSQLTSFYWSLSFFILAAAVYYFIRLAYQLRSLNFMFFAVIYGYIGLNISIFNLIADFEDIIFLLAYLSPFYFGGSIYLFIKTIKDFKNKTKK